MANFICNPLRPHIYQDSTNYLILFKYILPWTGFSRFFISHEVLKSYFYGGWNRWSTMPFPNLENLTGRLWHGLMLSECHTLWRSVKMDFVRSCILRQRSWLYSSAFEGRYLESLSNALTWVQVIQETLRLAPVVKFMPRVALEDVQFKGNIDLPTHFGGAILDLEKMLFTYNKLYVGLRWRNFEMRAWNLIEPV